jgi:hypothetical protein
VTDVLRDAGLVVEAQFIVGLENETAATLEETYPIARDWNPDLANWAMYTPWPLSDLLREFGDSAARARAPESTDPRPTTGTKPVTRCRHQRPGQKS